MAIEKYSDLYTGTLSGKYNPPQALAPTNEIEGKMSKQPNTPWMLVANVIHLDAIRKLKEVYHNKFISHAEYEQKLSKLMADKQFSFMDIIPQVEPVTSLSTQYGPRSYLRVYHFSVSSRSKSRTVRLFVSSTFRDMQDEREVIIKNVRNWFIFS